MAWSLRSTCIWCKCGWEHHLHVNFSQVKKPRTFKNVHKEEQLLEETDALLLKQRLIADCTRQMEEYLEEQRIIKAASIRFAVYLKKNAILPYNDVYEEYAKLCIENEEMCVRVDRNRDRTKLANLRRCLAEYRQERDAIIAGIEAGKGVERGDIDDIDKCKQGLFGLKHFGAELRKSYDAALAGYEHYNDASFELTGPKFWVTNGKKKSSKSLMAHVKSAAKHPIKTATAAYHYLA
ncbi:aaa atpase domain containing protein [Aphelenchoides avenae]|nr:aaa atpase domain containing protein [Aphelenchus avenae]